MLVTHSAYFFERHRVALVIEEDPRAYTCLRQLDPGVNGRVAIDREGERFRVHVDVRLDDRTDLLVEQSLLGVLKEVLLLLGSVLVVLRPDV